MNNKVEIYLKQRKDNLRDKIILLNVKLNKNCIEIGKIDAKIKEIDEKVDVAMEVFSPHTQINDFTREEIHNLSEKKKQLIEINDEIIKEIEELNSEEQLIEDAISDLDKLNDKIREKLDNEESSENIVEEKEEKYKISGITILEMQEMERQRIARDLHDSPVQVLTNCIHKAELCSRVIDLDPIRAKLELEILSNTIRETINEIRGIILDLRPMAFDDLGFEISLEKIINQIKIESKMKIDIEYVGEKVKITPLVGLTIIRIVQEACNNSIKHSKGKNIKITFIYSEKSIKLNIEDDGTGYDTSKSESGFGLSIMKERVYLLNGIINIESNNSGTKILLEIPFDGGSDSECKTIDS